MAEPKFELHLAGLPAPAWPFLLRGCLRANAIASVLTAELSLPLLAPPPELPTPTGSVVFCSDDTPHVPNEKLGEAAVVGIVDRLTRLFREVFPGKTRPSAPLKHFLSPRQCPAW